MALKSLKNYLFEMNLFEFVVILLIDEPHMKSTICLETASWKADLKYIKHYNCDDVDIQMLTYLKHYHCDDGIIQMLPYIKHYQCDDGVTQMLAYIKHYHCDDETIICISKYSKMTTPVEDDVYRTNSKQILVSRDPIYVHPEIIRGQYIGREPHTYLPFAIMVTIINPILGPIAILFSFMSRRSYKDGDLNYAYKWSNYAFLSGMITIIASTLLYIAIGFALSGPSLRGGHSY
ncbi:hypothetical protein Btru_006380 [Bulinus truncatus]|nr:hypothetical protein Btru_006380 [Bulinus truncatus]